MKDNFTIRKATIKDLKDILSLHLKLFKNEYQEFDKSLNMNWTYGEGKKCFKDRIIKKSGFVEVVENKRKIVGYLCGGIKKRLSYRKKAKYTELENMFIIKKFRGKGLGTALVTDFINWCKKNKVDYISIAASAQNNLGIRFYKKAGFEEYDLILEMKLSKNRARN